MRTGGVVDGAAVLAAGGEGELGRGQLLLAEVEDEGRVGDVLPVASHVDLVLAGTLGRHKVHTVGALVDVHAAPTLATTQPVRNASNVVIKMQKNKKKQKRLNKTK